MIFKMTPDQPIAANARITFMMRFFHSVTFPIVIITPQMRIQMNPISNRRDIVNLISPPMKIGKTSL